jgi:hypothetical protein
MIFTTLMTAKKLRHEKSVIISISSSPFAPPTAPGVAMLKTFEELAF